MNNPTIPTTQLTSDREVDSEIPCHHCGYNLYSAHIDAACPECGTPVEQSLDIATYPLKNSRLNKRFFSGLILNAITNTICLIVLLPFILVQAASMISYAMTEQYNRNLDPFLKAYQYVLEGSNFINYLLIAIAFFLYTPKIQRFDHYSRDRRVYSIIMAIAIPLIYVAMIFMLFRFWISRSYPNLSFGSFNIHQIITAIYYVAAFPSLLIPFATAWWGRRLASITHAPKLKSAFQITALAALLYTLVTVLFWCGSSIWQVQSLRAYMIYTFFFIITYVLYSIYALLLTISSCLLAIVFRKQRNTLNHAAPPSLSHINN
ncbi:hypothetical protein [Poriferisphaera corsica]|nr:hypothetical protein [Poriferisphaera corsica]